MGGEEEMIRFISILLLILSFPFCKGKEQYLQQKPVSTKAPIPSVTQKKESITQKRDYLMETLEDLGILRIYNDEWDTLSLKEKLFIYYLYRASIVGDLITYDQRNINNLTIKSFLEALYLNKDKLPKEFLPKFFHYFKLFWINHGIHEVWTGKKFVPQFNFDQLVEATLYLIKNGVELGIKDKEEVISLLKKKIYQPMFDPEFEPFCTNKNPPEGKDIITASSNSFYIGVSLKDLTNFKERYPLNSRIIKKEDGSIVEVPYRAGNNQISPGLYSKELLAVIKYMREAIRYADSPQKENLETLIRYFETGEEELFKEYNVGWVKYSPRVDAILGFIETYLDARGVKGTWEGVVMYVNQKKTTQMKFLGDNSHYFEDKAPWNHKYKRSSFNPLVANGVDVVVATGDGGPIGPVGINLPNYSEIREKYGSKNFFLVNFMEAANQAYGDLLIREFSLNPEEEVKVWEKCGDISWNALVMLHEVTGHGSGKVLLKEDPKFYLKEYYSTLEEARADLVALWHAFDPKLKEGGIIPDEECAQFMYRDYVRGFLTRLRRIPEGDIIEEDHIRAQSLIVMYALDKGAIKEVIKDGHYYLEVVNLEKLREVWGELLEELMRIKAEGDYNAIKALVDKYGVKLNTKWRDDVISRAKKLALIRYVAFISPILKPVKDEKGEIVDIKLITPNSITDTMDEWIKIQREEIPDYTKLYLK